MVLGSVQKLIKDMISHNPYRQNIIWLQTNVLHSIILTTAVVAALWLIYLGLTIEQLHTALILPLFLCTVVGLLFLSFLTYWLHGHWGEPVASTVYLTGIGIEIFLLFTIYGEPFILLALVLMPVIAGLLGKPFGSFVIASLITIILTVYFLYIPSQLSETMVWIISSVSFCLAVLLWLGTYPLRGTTQWAWTNFVQAQLALEKARDRNAQLDQVLEELLHANRQLDLLNERLTGLRTRAEAAERAKTAFVAKVSHEFRTPLNMIIGLIDLLLETPHIYGQPLPVQLRQDLKIVHRNCEHLSSLINDVLDLSQAEAGKLTLRREWGDLAADVAHAVEVVRPLIEKKGLSLYIKMPEHRPLVYRDQLRVRQVLLNLLSNAARYTMQGSISIELSPAEYHVLLKVADTGPGIPESDLPHIFEPFFQSASAVGRSRDGNGLGLSISKQFIELHNGRLWVESEINVGTTFLIQLPIAPPRPPAIKPEGWINEKWMWMERASRTELPLLPRSRRLIIYDETEALHSLLEAMSMEEENEIVVLKSLEDAHNELARVPAHALLINTADSARLLSLMSSLQCKIRDTPVIGSMLPSSLEQTHLAGAIDYLIK